MKASKLIGWAMIGGAVLLFLLGLADALVCGAFDWLALLLSAVLLGAALVFPGTLLLRAKWNALATLLAGVISLAVLLLLNSWTNELLREFDGRWRDAYWLPPVGLVICVSPLILSLWISRKLPPRLLRLFSRKVDGSARVTDGR